MPKVLHPCQPGHENSCPIAGIDKKNPVCENMCNVKGAWLKYIDGEPFNATPPPEAYKYIHIIRHNGSADLVDARYQQLAQMIPPEHGGPFETEKEMWTDLKVNQNLSIRELTIISGYVDNTVRLRLKKFGLIGGKGSQQEIAA